MASEGSRTAVVAAFVGNLTVAITKFVAAGITGSSANASRSDRSRMRSTMLATPRVESIGRLLTMHMGPDDILVNADVDLVDGITDTQVEDTIDRVEAAIGEVLPEASNIFVELESRRG